MSRLSPFFRQRLVGGIPAQAVGMTFDFKFQAGMSQDNAGDLCQFLASRRL